MRVPRRQRARTAMRCLCGVQRQRVCRCPPACAWCALTAARARHCGLRSRCKRACAVWRRIQGIQRYGLGFPHERQCARVRALRALLAGGAGACPPPHAPPRRAGRGRGGTAAACWHTRCVGVPLPSSCLLPSSAPPAWSAGSSQ